MAARNPEDVDRLFGEYLNAGNVEGIVALYEPSAALLLEAGAPLVGREAIREGIKQFMAMRPHIEMKVVRVVHAGGDIAVLYNDWRLTMQGPDGQSIEDCGKACEIVRRQADGSWLFVVDDPRVRG
jgi:uncharacterized protein (TIGR02246 family)